MSSPWRAGLERRSAVPLAWLAQRPRWVPLVVVLALLLGSAVLPATLGLLCLALVLAGAAWLTALSWPVLDTGARAARVGVLVLVLALATTRLS